MESALRCMACIDNVMMSNLHVFETTARPLLELTVPDIELQR
jgi:hypothetical protein